MTDTNQKLREALHDAATSLETISRLAGKAVYQNGDFTHMGTFADVRGYATSRACVARQALALPTAAPVGDLPELPEPTWSTGLGVAFTADQMRAYALSALSAGDTADAQRYRWLLDNYAIGDGYDRIDAALNDGNADTHLSPAIDAAIDAAMRKGQL